MQVRDLITLYDYYYWATEKILAQAAQVTPAQWAGPPPVGDRSLQRTLVHTLDAERGWRYSWTGQDDFVPLQAADFPDAATLAARWREEETALRAYLGSLSDADLQGGVLRPRRAGPPARPVAGHRPRLLPRDAAPQRGGHAADPLRPLAGGH
ncbi:MAG: DinB family protein [Thermomicrobiales bacterium]